MLWAHGISGDLPIVLVRIDHVEDLEIVRQLLRAHEYWRMKRLAVDLVILNERPSSYAQDLQASLEALVRASQSRPHSEGEGASGALFILRADLTSVDARRLLQSVARAVLLSHRGSLAEQVTRLGTSEPAAAPPPERRPASGPPEPAPPRRARVLHGLWLAGGREYDDPRRGSGRRRPGQRDRQPVVRLPGVGGGRRLHVAGNSCENHYSLVERPVGDRPGEVITYATKRPERLGSTALPIRQEADSTSPDGQGYSRFERTSHGISLELLQYVSPVDPIKISRLEIRNHSGRSRRLSVTAYVEWVLAASREAAAPFIVTEIDAETGAMLARNPWNTGFGDRVAFADLAGRQHTWTGDRTEFLGRNGTLDRPAALAGGAPLANRVGAGLDPCGAMQTRLELEPNERAEIVFLDRRRRRQRRAP
jgi:cyclic beta-1,2-glucan synthetase